MKYVDLQVHNFEVTVENMTTNNSDIRIIGIDAKSKLRGVGRYVQALEEVLVVIPATNTNVVINPFFSLSGAKINGDIFPGDSNSIAVIHDVIPLKYKNKFPLGIMGKIKLDINKKNLQKYKTIVTDSNASAQDIEKVLKIPKEKIKIIYPFSPLSSGIIRSKKPQNLPNSLLKNSFALYVGDVNWHKNIVNAAKACVEANIPLVCVGKSFEMINKKIPNHRELDEIRSFQTIVKASPKMIHVLGYLPDDEVAWLYENTLVNLLLSHDEGFGYSYIEAGYFATPSILSDISIFREISNSKGAFFVNQNSIESITNQLVRLKNSPEIRSEAGKDAKIRSIFFSKEKFANDWKRLLTKPN